MRTGRKTNQNDFRNFGRREKKASAQTLSNVSKKAFGTAAADVWSNVFAVVVHFTKFWRGPTWGKYASWGHVRTPRLIDLCLTILCSIPSGSKPRRRTTRYLAVRTSLATFPKNALVLSTAPRYFCNIASSNMKIICSSAVQPRKFQLSQFSWGYNSPP